MFTWHEAGTYCEEVYGVHLDSNEGFFICPECGEPIYEKDWPRERNWRMCPICEIDWEDGY